MQEPRSNSSSLTSGRSKRISNGSFELVVSSHNRASGRLRQIFSNIEPDIQNDDDESEEEDTVAQEQKRSMWLARVDSYSRLMHAHTAWQMEGKTLPGYQKTIHAYTKNQLDMHKTLSKSETSSPHLAARLPNPICAQLSQLVIDDVPIPPASSPVQQEKKTIITRGAKPRSTTEPVPRDFAQNCAVRNVACG